MSSSVMLTLEFPIRLCVHLEPLCTLLTMKYLSEETETLFEVFIP